MRSSLDGYGAVTPVKDAQLTKGNLHWFQRKQKQWRESPRKKVAALTPPPKNEGGTVFSSATSKTPPTAPPQPRNVAPQTLFQSPPPAPQNQGTQNTTAFGAFSSPAVTSPFTSPFPQSQALSFPKQNSVSFGATPAKETISFAPAKQLITPNTNSTQELPPESQKTSEKLKISIDQDTTTPAKETKQSHRERLVEFYTKYNPSKLDTVDATLASYQGKEDVLFEKLQEKYVKVKDGMLPPSGTGPCCFLDFQVDGTPVGRVVVKLYQDKAPLACENFRSLCTGEKGKGQAGKNLCFQGCQMHRIVPNFCIQGGDFTKGDGTGGESIYSPGSEHGDMWGKFKDETPFMMHSRKGLLSMANNGPNRNGSQFFITLKPLPNLDGKHVVFGEVVQGLDVVGELGKLATNAKQQPLKPVVIVECGQLGDDGNVMKSSKSELASNTSSQPFGVGLPTFGASGTSNASSSTKLPSPFATFSFGNSAPAPAAPSLLGMPAQTQTPSLFPVPSATTSSAPTEPKADSSKTSSIFSGQTTPLPFGDQSKAESPLNKPNPFATFSGGNSGPSSFGMPAPTKTPSLFSVPWSTASSAPMEPKADSSKNSSIFSGQNEASASAPLSLGGESRSESSSKKPNPFAAFSGGNAAPSPFVMPAQTKTTSPFSAPASTTSSAPTDPKADSANSSSIFSGQKETSASLSSALKQSPPSSVFGANLQSSTSSKKIDESNATTVDKSPFSFGFKDSATSTLPKASTGPSPFASFSTNKQNGPRSSWSFGLDSNSAAEGEGTSAPESNPGDSAKEVKFNAATGSTVVTFSSQAANASGTSKAASSDAQKFAFGEIAPGTKESPFGASQQPPTFSFGKSSNRDNETASAQSTGLSEGAKSSVPSFSFGTPATANPKLPTPTFSFGTMPGSDSKASDDTTEPVSRQKGATESSKPTLPSFYFGKDKVAPSVSTGTNSAPKQPDDGTKKVASKDLCYGEKSTPSSETAPAGKGAPVAPVSSPRDSAVAISKRTTTGPLPVSDKKADLNAGAATAAEQEKSASKSDESSFAATQVRKDDVSFASFSPAFILPKDSRGKVDEPPEESLQVPGHPIETAIEAGMKSPILPENDAQAKAQLSEEKDKTAREADSIAMTQQEKPVSVPPIDSIEKIGKPPDKSLQEAGCPAKTANGAGIKSPVVPEKVAAIDKTASVMASTPQKAQLSKEKETNSVFSTQWEKVHTPNKLGNISSPVSVKKSPGSARKSPSKGGYSIGRKRLKDVTEAVADILAERVFSDDQLIAQVTVEQVEKVMALPVERMVALLEDIDRLESRGLSFSWVDIENAVKASEGMAANENLESYFASGDSIDEFKSCASHVQSMLDQDKESANGDDDLDSCASSADHGGSPQVKVIVEADVSASGQLQRVKHTAAGENDEDDLELLLQNLETLN